MSHLTKVVALGLCGLLVACQASEAGLDPPADDLFYPTGLAVDPKGDVLYVTNGNSDLRYNGGTLLALDLTQLRADLAAFRDTGTAPDALDGDPRKECRRDVTVPYVVECRAPRYAYADQTIKLGNFGGQIAVATLGGQDAARLYLPVRGEPSLTWINASRAGGGLELNCGNSGPLERCADRYRLVELQRPALDPSRPDELPDPELMPAEPYGVFADERVGALYLTGFAGGELSLFDIHRLQGADPEYADIHRNLFTADASGLTGAVSVAVRPCRSYEGVPVEPLAPEGSCDPAEQTDGTFIYVSSHYSAEVSVLSLRGRSGPCDPAAGELDPCTTSPTDLRLVSTGLISLDALDPASDTRGLAFSDDGTRLFVVDRHPPGLIVIDTSLEDGLPRNKMMDAIALCPEPSLLYLEKIGGASRAFVVCFASGSAYVVDTDALRLVDTITLGQGPYAMAFALDDPDQPLGFVANYVDNDIGVIDLRPGSPTEHKVIARIGYPTSTRSD